MSWRSMSSLSDKIGQLKEGLGSISRMDKQSQNRLRTKTNKLRIGIQKVIKDEITLHRAFVLSVPVSWIDGRGTKRTTVLSEFLTVDEINERIWDKQAALKVHVKNLTTIGKLIKSHINLSRAPDRPKKTNASRYARTAKINSGLAKGSDDLTALGIILQQIVNKGTGPGRSRGIKSAHTRELIRLIVKEARNWRKLTGTTPGVSRSTDGKRVYGPFLRHIITVAAKRGWVVTASQIDDVIKLIKRSPDCPTDLFSYEARTQSVIYSAFLAQS